MIQKMINYLISNLQIRAQSVLRRVIFFCSLDLELQIRSRFNIILLPKRFKQLILPAIVLESTHTASRGHDKQITFSVCDDRAIIAVAESCGSSIGDSKQRTTTKNRNSAARCIPLARFEEGRGIKSQKRTHSMTLFRNPGSSSLLGLYCS